MSWKLKVGDPNVENARSIFVCWPSRKKELCDGVEGKWIKCVQIVDQGVRWVPPAFPFTSLSLSPPSSPVKETWPRLHKRLSFQLPRYQHTHTHTRASWYLHLSQPSAAAALAFIPRVFSSRNNNKQQPKSSRTIMSLACRGKKEKVEELELLLLLLLTLLSGVFGLFGLKFKSEM